MELLTWIYKGDEICGLNFSRELISVNSLFYWMVIRSRGTKYKLIHNDGGNIRGSLIRQVDKRYWVGWYDSNCVVEGF